ncbi:MAG: hypothetical protein WAU24_01015 [Chitinophagaceae bacterium]
MLLFLPLWVEKIISAIAAVFIIIAQVIFVIDIFKRKIKPSVLSWIGWALLMGTSLVSQIFSMGWAWSLTGLAFSTIGCVCIFFTAISLKQYIIKKTDWKFLALGFICVIIYYISKNPWLTTCFAILADLAVGIPTLVHAYKEPHTQKTVAWKLGLISWILSLFLCIGHDWLYTLFPVYLILFNTIMIFFTREKAYNRK